MKNILRSMCCGLALALPLGGALAQTSPSVLNPPPAAPPASPAPTPPAQSTPASAAPVANDTYLLGRVYRVETMQGTTFTGTLVSMSLTALEFDAKDLGAIKLERTQIRRAELQGPVSAGTKAGYYDIGNGNRLFFAPTARGLRKGEGALQNVDLYLLGVNYGISDYFSIGGYVSMVPWASLDNQFIVLTPKLSLPISENVHVGVGALYLRIPEFDGALDRAYGSGILYGAATYGSADNNVTAGLGYGFFDGEVGSTPVVLLGGQKRVSRRISLISENYIIADSEAGMGGLYGLKFNWRRTSLGVAGGYIYIFNPDPFGYRDPDARSLYTSYVVPVYVDFTFRFGKTGK